MADETVEGREETSPALRRRAKRSPNGVNRSTLCVQLTSEERALLEAKAENTGQSMSRILVSSALRPSTSETINGADLDRLNTEFTLCRRSLSRVTANLNQLSHHANVTQEFPAQAAEVAAQVRSALFGLQDLIESIER